MRFPEYRDAEYSTTDIPPQSFLQANSHRVKKLLILLVSLLLIFYGLYHFFSYVLNEAGGDFKLALLSVGSALVTVFSAVISVLTLVSSESLKKYEDDVNLLQMRYLDGRSVFKWEFLKRSSYYERKSALRHSYYINSACYKLFYGESDENSLEIVVPVLEVDFFDVPCLRQISRIKRILPDYIVYIIGEQKKFNEAVVRREDKQPSYYLPLPYHLIALYKNIFTYKVAQFCTEICFLFIITSICLTIIEMI